MVMDVKKEILTLCQLLGLLYLLFQSFTWNLPPGFDFFEPRAHLKSISENDLKDALRLDTKSISSMNEHGSINYMDRKSVQRLPALANSMLPPFNIWKEIEITKQERNEEQDKIPDRTKLSRRKLNYASSKCGAKVLAANNEAKHRAAILNEKIDEYMLNPCKAQSWFIIELCDNIRATQIELANYELYSSAPKLFQAFWSDVYPAKTWHHLGTFEAKDRKTMQTFELESSDMIKFIKVILNSHYGKEHYCPLSVLRVLGYSMVYEYDNMDIENKIIKPEINETDKTAKKMSEKALNSKNGNSTYKEIQNRNRSFSNKQKSESFLMKTCKQNKKYCIFQKNKIQSRSADPPSCLFLKRITSKSRYIHVCNNVCNKITLKKYNVTYNTKLHNKLAEKKNMKQSKFIANANVTNNNTGTEEIQTNNNSSLVLSNLFRGKEHLFHKSSFNKFQFLDRGPTSSKQVENKELEDNEATKSNSITILKRFNVDIPKRKSKHEFREQNGNSNKNKDVSDSNDNCGSKKDTKLIMDTKYRQATYDSSSLVEVLEQSTESAALIQKESVLVKLNSRMKASEMNLDLINEYLQQLSQSYRHHMEDMQNIFNVTLKAILEASEEANRIDKQQQFIIEHLEHQVKALDYHTQYLSNAQRDILKRVLELHGFFLILEFIIMSTIFSICVNKYRKQIY